MSGDIKILVVDDDPRNLDALEAILSDASYSILRAGNADHALRLLLENADVAAIILDIQMPNVNGIELARTIKGAKRFRHVPILFLTAHLVDEQDIILGYGAGGVDYVTKPFNPQILRQKVSVFADLFRKSRALAQLNEHLELRVQERTAELERSEAALREAARQKDEFLAVLAHELRNPLAPLRYGVGLLGQMEGTAPPSLGPTLAMMDRQIDHLVRLIDDLLDVSRISRGALELKRQRTDLVPVVQASVDATRPLLQHKKIAVTFESHANPSGMFDATRVAQIIGNLIHNALKFSKPGGTIALDLSYDEAAGMAVVKVRDSGAGIAPEVIDRIFEMFERVGPEGGSGIGLALSRKLAEMHDGRLNAWSAGPGLGSTFTLMLPAEAGATAVATEASGAATGWDKTANPLSLVLIEDNDDIADSLSEVLEASGHRVRIARDGHAGVDLVLSSRPEVVLCDIGLPGLDGVEVCKRIVEQLGSTRPLMVALTGWGNDKDQQRTASAGFDHHMVKPVPLKQLFTLLDSVPRKG